MSILILGPDKTRASLFADPDTGGVFVTGTHLDGDFDYGETILVDNIVALGPDNQRRSLYCDPVSKGIYFTEDPNDTTPLPAGAQPAKSLYTTDEGALILAEE